MNWELIIGFCGLTFTLYAMNKSNQENLSSFKDDIKNEMKDFHGRLCALEERYIQMMQRFLEQNRK